MITQPIIIIIILIIKRQINSHTHDCTEEEAVSIYRYELLY